MKLGLQWIVATTVAVVLANLAVEILFFAVMGCALLVVLPLVGGVIGGFPIGVSQWLVLRRFPGSKAWIVATTVGFALTWTLGAILLAVMLTISGAGADWMTLLAFALPTPIIGLAQARVIRRWTARTTVWVVASRSCGAQCGAGDLACAQRRSQAGLPAPHGAAASAIFREPIPQHSNGSVRRT